MNGLSSRPEVHLWSRRLDLDAGPSERDLARLGPDERARAEGFRRSIDRHRFIGRHLHLRDVLAIYLGVAPDRVPLAAPLHEPPRLTSGEAASDLRFSLSGSADRSAIAIAWHRPVGVDIERIDPSVDTMSVARTLFSRGECAALDAASPDRRRALFFRIWARKEAFVKALGLGFGRDLESFDVLASDDGAAVSDQALVVDRDADLNDPRWLVTDVSGPSGFSRACCAEGDDWSIVLKEDDA